MTQTKSCINFLISLHANLKLWVNSSVYYTFLENGSFSFVRIKFAVKEAICAGWNKIYIWMSWVKKWLTERRTHALMCKVIAYEILNYTSVKISTQKKIAIFAVVFDEQNLNVIFVRPWPRLKAKMHSGWEPIWEVKKPF
jgi:hypothetical protein